MLEEEVKKFLANATWLNADDGAWTVALMMAAKRLDSEWNGATFGHYVRVLGILEKRRPVGPVSDPVGDAIDGLRK